MLGTRRTHGSAPKRASPATAARTIAMAPPPDRSLATLRDRVLLLFGFVSVFRRKAEFAKAQFVATRYFRPMSLQAPVLKFECSYCSIRCNTASL